MRRRQLPPSIALVTILLFLGVAETSAQTPKDTTQAAPRDTVAATDSLHSTFLAGIGTIREETDTTEWFVTRFIWTDAGSIGDLFRLTPGVILRELGEAGQPAEITAQGIGWRGLSFLLDGRPMNDPVTGTLNLYDLPIEFIDHLERWTGLESFFPGGNGPAETMNIVTRQYNTGRPITKIRFMQGPNEHLLTDALFTQNIVRGLNLTFGVQRRVADGRFVNSGYDSWSVRTRLRYNFSERLNISLMDLYHRSVTGMNGGVNLDSTRTLGLDPFNEAESIVFSKLSNDTRSRRDVTFSLIAALFPDTAWSTKVTLSFSTAERSYNDPSSLTSGLFDRYSWKSTGGTIRQTFRPGLLTVITGGEFETRHANLPKLPTSISKTYLAWFGNAHGEIFRVFEPQISARGESYDQANTFSHGASLTFKPSAAFAVKAGYTSSYRFPTIQESNWPSYRFDPSHGLNLLEHHNLALVSVSVNMGQTLSISATASRRTIDNALLFKPAASGISFAPPILEIAPTLTLRQISGRVRLKFWDLEATGGMTFTETEQESKLDPVQPKHVLTGELAYHSKLLKGALETRLGIQSRYASSHQGERYLASVGVYEEQGGPTIPSFSTLNLFGVFKIGDAFITITWENVFDEQYYTVYPYPELGRNVRIGLNWIFLD